MYFIFNVSNYIQNYTYLIQLASYFIYKFAFYLEGSFRPMCNKNKK